MYVEIFEGHGKYMRSLQRKQAFQGSIERAHVSDPIHISLGLRLGQHRENLSRAVLIKGTVLFLHFDHLNTITLRATISDSAKSGCRIDAPWRTTSRNGRYHLLAAKLSSWLTSTG